MKVSLVILLLSLIATTTVLAQQPEENDPQIITIADEPEAEVQTSTSIPPSTVTPRNTPTTPTPSPTPTTTLTTAGTTRVERISTAPSHSSTSTTSVDDDSRRHSTTRVTTTPKPEPVNPPQFPENVGNWTIKGVNSSCIVVTGALQIHLKQTGSPELVLNVPNSHEHVNIEGDCGPNNQHLTMNWWSSNETTKVLRNNTLRFKFSKMGEDQYGLQNIKYAYIEEDANGTNKSLSTELPGPFFTVPLNHSYSCLARQNIEEKGNSLSLKTEHIQVEAFRDDRISQDDLFSQAEECRADHKTSTGTMLAVGVGIGLALVVCAALGAYLFKRCRRDGYQHLESHE